MYSPSRYHRAQQLNGDEGLDTVALLKSPAYLQSSSLSAVPILHSQINNNANQEQDYRFVPRTPRSILSNSRSRSANHDVFKQVRFEEHQRQDSESVYSYEQKTPEYNEDDLFHPSPPISIPLQAVSSSRQRIEFKDSSCPGSTQRYPSQNIWHPSAISTFQRNTSFSLQLSQPNTVSRPFGHPPQIRALTRKPVGSASSNSKSKVMIVKTSCKDELNSLEQIGRLQLSLVEAKSNTRSLSSPPGSPTNCISDDSVTDNISATASSLISTLEQTPLDPLLLLLSLIHYIISFLPPFKSLSSADGFREFHASATWFVKLLMVLYLAASLWAIVAAVRDVLLKSLEPIGWILSGLGWILGWTRYN